MEIKVELRNLNSIDIKNILDKNSINYHETNRFSECISGGQITTYIISAIGGGVIYDLLKLSLKEILISLKSNQHIKVNNSNVKTLKDLEKIKNEVLK